MLPRRFAVLLVLSLVSFASAGAAIATDGPRAASPLPRRAFAPVVANDEPRAPTFPSGLYIVSPSLAHAGGVIQAVDTVGAFSHTIEFFGTGWDISTTTIVVPNQTNSGLIVYNPDGTSRQVLTPGLYGVGRPSLSPDGRFAAVQATETPYEPPQNPVFFTIYIVDLSTGGYRMLVARSANPLTGNELPIWFPSGDRVLHQGIEYLADGTACEVIRVVDATTGNVLLTIRRGGVTGCYQPQQVLELPQLLSGPPALAIGHSSTSRGVGHVGLLWND